MQYGFTGIVLILLGLSRYCTDKKEGGQEGYQSIRRDFVRNRQCF